MNSLYDGVPMWVVATCDFLLDFEDIAHRREQEFELASIIEPALAGSWVICEPLAIKGLLGFIIVWFANCGNSEPSSCWINHCYCSHLALLFRWSGDRVWPNEVDIDSFSWVYFSLFRW